MIVFGAMSLKVMIRTLGWIVIHTDWCPYEKGTLDTKRDTRDVSAEKKLCEDI